MYIHTHTHSMRCLRKSGSALFFNVVKALIIKMTDYLRDLASDDDPESVIFKFHEVLQP